MRSEQGWADAHALTRLLQWMGRSVRSEDDHAITYVLDSNAHSLVRKCARVIPVAYHDALGIGLRSGRLQPYPLPPCAARIRDRHGVLAVRLGRRDG